MERNVVANRDDNKETIPSKVMAKNYSSDPELKGLRGRLLPKIRVDFFLALLIFLSKD